MSQRRIRVLIADGSALVRAALALAIVSDPQLEVVGVAGDGDQLLAAVRQLQPDVAMIDIHLPRSGGIDATRRLMHEHPLPIVAISGAGDDPLAARSSATDAGALAALARPAGPGSASHRSDVVALNTTLKLMAAVKTVRRRPPADSDRSAESRLRPVIVAIGASTGGPSAIAALLGALPKDFAAPLLIVQHIAVGFLEGFVQWLDASTGFPVRLAAGGERPLPGHAYVAPDGGHLGIDRRGCIVISDAAPENGLRPAVDYLLRSVRERYGAQAAGVLLSGMGRDGAAELLALKRLGAQTFAQDLVSSAVHGMPGAAIRLDAARHVLSPPEIAVALRRLCGATRVAPIAHAGDAERAAPGGGAAR